MYYNGWQELTAS